MSWIGRHQPFKCEPAAYRRMPVALGAPVARFSNAEAARMCHVPSVQTGGGRHRRRSCTVSYILVCKVQSKYTASSRLRTSS
jgi:hypothetical protein